ARSARRRGAPAPRARVGASATRARPDGRRERPRPLRTPGDLEQVLRVLDALLEHPAVGPRFAALDLLELGLCLLELAARVGHVRLRSSARWLRLGLLFLLRSRLLALALRHRHVDRADHVESLLGQLVVLAVEDLAEALDRVLELDVLAGGARELLGDEV